MGFRGLSPDSVLILIQLHRSVYIAPVYIVYIHVRAEVLSIHILYSNLIIGCPGIIQYRILAKCI